MTDEVVIYISAAADVAAEREILGRAVAEVPVDLPWRVIQSPAGNGPVDLEALVGADIHVLVMGGDIRAPVGLEWQVARRYGRQPAAYLKVDVLRTPAGRDFIRLVREVQPWLSYSDGSALRRSVLMRIADYLTAESDALRLSLEELRQLKQWRIGLASDVEAVDEELRGGAGDSAVLISRERFQPSGGIILGEREPDGDS